MKRLAALWEVQGTCGGRSHDSVGVVVVRDYRVEGEGLEAGAVGV